MLHQKAINNIKKIIFEQINKMQKTESRVKIIGIYQIIGGLIGLIVTLLLLVKFGFSNGATFKIPH